MKKNYITITKPAQDYLRKILADQDGENIGIRIYVENPGISSAQCCMAFCPLGEQEEGDVIVRYKGFHVYLDQASRPYLRDAILGYSKTGLEGQLTFHAPKSKSPNAGGDPSLEGFMEQYREGNFKR